jgi:hypothetical protein
MDDLEFRRAVFAEPFSEDEQLRQAAVGDSSKQAFVKEVRHFDEKLSAALAIDVPPNMAERLLLRQTLESHNQNKRRSKIHLALAASVAFTIGISVQVFYSPFANSDIGSYSLAHIEHGISHLYNAKEKNTLAQVYAKLARFGGKLEQPLGQVVFSNYCQFGGVTSLHLIYDSPQGRVSVFVTPTSADFEFVDEFSNDRFVGKGLAFDNAQITIVGDKDQSLDGFTKKLEQSLSWAI